MNKNLTLLLILVFSVGIGSFKMKDNETTESNHVLVFEDFASFQIGISSLPIRGNTEYDILISNEPGNASYRVTPITGFYTVGQGAADAPHGPGATGDTKIRIKTYPNVSAIVGAVEAFTYGSGSGGAPGSWGDYTTFSYMGFSRVY